MTLCRVLKTDPFHRAQNSPKALYNMVFGPKGLEICVLRALGFILWFQFLNQLTVCAQADESREQQVSGKVGIQGLLKGI